MHGAYVSALVVLVILNFQNAKIANSMFLFVFFVCLFDNMCVTENHKTSTDIYTKVRNTDGVHMYSVRITNYSQIS